MKNQMGFIVNDSDYKGHNQYDEHYGMGFFDLSDLEDLATSTAENLKNTTEAELQKKADETVKKLLGTDEGKVTKKEDGTIIIQKEAAAPMTRYINQPSTIPTWVWITMGGLGVTLVGLIAYRTLKK